MVLARESIYGALFARLQTIPGLKLTSRRLRSISDTPSNQLPALYMAQTFQRPLYEAGRQTQWELGADVYIYCTDYKSKGSATLDLQFWQQTFGVEAVPPYMGGTAAIIMNWLMDGLSEALAFDNIMNNACTLGGLALKCEIGEVETDEGTMGKQAIVRAPITILVRG